MIRRFSFLPAFTGAVFVTTALFCLMHFLVQYDPVTPTSGGETFQFQFRQAIPERQPPPTEEITEPELKQPDPPPPKPTDTAVEPVDPVRTPPVATIDALPGFGEGPTLVTGPEGRGGADNGALVPIVRIQPPYPRRAALAGTEGWVKVSFTVTETGAVIDPRVEDANPPRIFDRAVLGTIVKWKFQPQRVDGRPVRVRAAQVIDFRL